MSRDAETVASDVKQLIRHLSDENRRLREQIHTIEVLPLPSSDDPGEQMWGALMEDLWSEGVVTRTVRYRDLIEFVFEPVTAGVPGLPKGSEE